MKKIVLRLAMAAACVLLASCSSMYIPYSANAPLLDHQGETVLDLNLSTNSVQFAGAYAVNGKLAVMANGGLTYGNLGNYYDIYTKKEADTSAFRDLTHWGHYNQRYVEAGVGAYNLVNHDLWKIEVFGGVGFSHADDEYTYLKNENHYYDSRYVLAFVQGNMGLSWKYVDFGVSARFAPAFHTLNYDCDVKGTPASYTFNFTVLHVEPVVFLRVGGPRVKATAKLGLSLPFESPEFTAATDRMGSYTHSTITHISFGLCARLGGKKDL